MPIHPPRTAPSANLYTRSLSSFVPAIAKSEPGTRTIAIPGKLMKLASDAPESIAQMLMPNNTTREIYNLITVFSLLLLLVVYSYPEDTIDIGWQVSLERH
jgi:hypothetical protein